MDVSLQPRSNPMTTGKGFVFFMVVTMSASILGVLQLALLGIEMGDVTFVTLAIVSLSINNEVIRSANNMLKAYVRRGIVLIVGSSVALWVYVGCARLFNELEPEFLRMMIQLLPVAAIGILVLPTIAERWIVGPTYSNPYKNTRPVIIALQVLLKAALYAGIVVGASALFPL